MLENLPRDLVLEQDPTSLAQLVSDIVGLQERQLVRVFEVPEPVGPWTTVLVYLPRSRFTAELPERIADVVAESYGASQRTFESFVATSSLARISVSVRRPDDASSADPTVLERVIDDLSTSWTDRLREALVGETGEAQGRELFERIGSHAPAAYMAAVHPGRATGDIQRIASLLDDDTDMTTAVAHDIDADERERRFRIYRRATPASLSELLPLLDHLGLRALDEQPFEFRSADGGCTSTTSASSSRRGRARRRPRTDLQAASPALFDGTIESDGFNRLVLAAGLTARRSRSCAATGGTCARSGSRSASRTSKRRADPHPRLVAAARRRCSRPASTRRGPPTSRRRRARRAPRRARRAARACSTPSRASTTTASAGCSSP